MSTKRMQFFSINLALALLLALSSTAHAVPIFSNFGAGNSYQTGSGLFVGDGDLSFGPNNYAQASTFTSGVSANLGSIVIALSDFGFGQVDPVTVSLFDSGMDVPGSNLLESFSIGANTLGDLGLNNAPLVLNSILHPLLSINTQYWLAVSSSVNNVVVWNFSDNDFANYNVESQSLDGGTTWAAPFGNTRGAFEVNPFATVSVPEPGMLALLSGGLLGLVGLRRRRQSR